MSDSTLRLVSTSYACPEQYDVYLDGVRIGYMRLRHGYFRAEYRGKICYESEPDGDGRLADGERIFELNQACASILSEHGEPLYTIEEKQEPTQ